MFNTDAPSFAHYECNFTPANHATNNVYAGSGHGDEASTPDATHRLRVLFRFDGLPVDTLL